MMRSFAPRAVLAGLATWSARLGKDSLIGYQASARGGTVRVTVAGDRCKLEGTAVTIWTGELV